MNTVKRLLLCALVAALPLGLAVLIDDALVLPVVIAFGLQWLAFIPAYLWRTEHFYDLMGSASYIIVALVAWLMADNRDLRSTVLLVMVALWAMRLGSFLIIRIRQQGGDRRFDSIRQDAGAFLVTWTLQGLWVSLTLLPVLIVFVSPSREVGALFYLGAALWLGGLLIEAVADDQKRRFRLDDANRGRFIQSGLWAWSRHPNYFGEILLWFGVCLAATATFSGWAWLGWLSPVFVALLLTKISGIPLLEASADERWGDSPDYQAYKRRTPVLVPRPPA